MMGSVSFAEPAQYDGAVYCPFRSSKGAPGSSVHSIGSSSVPGQSLTRRTSCCATSRSEYRLLARTASLWGVQKMSWLGWSLSDCRGTVGSSAMTEKRSTLRLGWHDGGEWRRMRRRLVRLRGSDCSPHIPASFVASSHANFHVQTPSEPRRRATHHLVSSSLMDRDRAYGRMSQMTRDRMIRVASNPRQGSSLRAFVLNTVGLHHR